MANQLWQVFRTYYTRRDYWFFALCVIPGLAPLIVLGPSKNPIGIFENMFPVLLINMLIGFIVGMQIKIQFANPRARLLPGFSAAHLIVPASMITAAMLLEWRIANVYSVPYFALAGYALFLIAAASWIFSIMRQDCNFLFMVFMFGSMFLPKYFVVPFLTSGIFVSVATFCIGFVALAALGARLVMLSEEMPEYAIVMPASMWDFMSRAARRDRGRLEAQMIARSRIRTWLQDIIFLPVFQNKTALNPPRRFLLNQLARGFSSVFIAITLFAIILIYFWIPHLFSMSMGNTSNAMNIGNTSNVTPSFLILSYLTLMMINMNGGSWLRRLPYLARESLFPISRTDFARDLLRSSMFDMAIAAVGFLVGMIVGLGVFHPQMLLSGSTSLYIAITISQFFFVGFIMLWVVSLRSFIHYICGVIVTIFLSMVVIFIAISGYWFLSLISVILAVAGIVGSYRLAYRCWCDVELD